ncbi:hypothetical protein BE04_39500 [Sorangium cellulosum]|uniref:Uncharacterized protein n=1 Tax=Sorangium cellulosum TaxID=56 RepID=A0A150PQ09_SORCE|nr:hypothetical protein BE04_39500 [Sorangium cellulosum]
MSNRSRATRAATSSGAGASARAGAAAKGKNDPFYLRSISPRTYNAFHALYQALRSAADGNAIAMEQGAARQQVGDDPELLIERMKQLQRAARVVNALRVALEQGPEVSLDAPFRWARTITGASPPVHPKRKLAPQKDFLLQEVTQRILALAQKAEPRLGQEVPLQDAARVLAEQATRLKKSRGLEHSAATDRRPRGPIEELAWAIARLPIDGRAQPALDALRQGSLASRAAQVTQALVNLGPSTWEDPALLLEHSFRAMGMPENEARSFFSYLEKRAKRQKQDE